MRFSVGAVNVRTGNFVYFDNTTHTIRPEHVMASGSLPPGFPAVEIEGKYYWDGGLISNTPLQFPCLTYSASDAAVVGDISDSARSFTGPFRRLRPRAQLIRPTWL
jgi:predicted acylesterase/phospholipase RssA